MNNSYHLLRQKRYESRRRTNRRESLFCTIWGKDKTRVALHSNRINHMLKTHPNTSMMSMNYFNDRMNRFHMNWRT